MDSDYTRYDQNDNGKVYSPVTAGDNAATDNGGTVGNNHRLKTTLEGHLFRKSN